MTITQMPCNAGNYTHPRTSAIRYIVIHYCGAEGTAANNGVYFGRESNIGASAHYFVDETQIVQSVADGDRAWHCGAKTYRHPECRNDNSLGVELCCYSNGDGTWRFASETVDNAVELVRGLMAKYSIDIDHIVRHYDVTGKVCPEPFVRDAAAWAAFKARLVATEEPEPETPAEPETQNQENQDGEEEDMVRYNTVDEMPAYYRDEAQKLIDSGALRGRGDGALDLSEDMLRTLIIVQRMLG